MLRRSHACHLIVKGRPKRIKLGDVSTSILLAVSFSEVSAHLQEKPVERVPLYPS